MGASAIHDVFVIGGGINGCGIARDAAGRGFSVVLAEMGDLGRCFGADLYEAEVHYLVENEWALTADDVLWRRAKRGLHFSRDEAKSLDAFLREAGGRHSVAAQ